VLDGALYVALHDTERDSHAFGEDRQSLVQQKPAEDRAAWARRPVTTLFFQRRVQAGYSHANHAREDVPCRSLIGGA
jgi:hypothetical protein